MIHTVEHRPVVYAFNAGDDDLSGVVPAHDTDHVRVLRTGD